MIPVAICIHYNPDLKHGCIVGRSATGECHGCKAYLDGEDFVGPSPMDARRAEAWREARGPGERKLPRAHFRGAGAAA